MVDYTPAQKSLHDRLFAWRNKALAHSTFEQRAAFRLPMKGGGPYLTMVRMGFDLERDGHLDLSLLADMCAKAGEACSQWRTEIEPRLTKLEDATRAQATATPSPTVSASPPTIGGGHSGNEEDGGSSPGLESKT